ncbi:MAG: DNA repair protein RadA [Patescibacteria group bacterium]|nr:DNA repair protein RadA [Patescibacteria group bacterium]MDD5121618.1 DNA repair protein RadA [Patescibacteria group bacterium]MDD5222268.1 DNA repair protein RadA [Patescibacteria group bacterium]MDD5396218.1 DNA repair protein RadA [Patescibacteria group bacterium]
MASNKLKIIFNCSKCDAQFPKWFGQCPECGSWGTLQEMVEKQTRAKSLNVSAGDVIDFEEVKGREFPRTKTGLEELDRVLGGGIVPGSLILLGGEPGIGKSTLVLQLAAKLANNSILYISGEESAEQIKMRLDRLKLPTTNLKFLGETDIEVICATIEKVKPSLAIIDSIQTIWFSNLPSEAGNVNQIKACTAKLLETAKKNNVPTVIIGHVTKEGFVAGPKTLEHLVDTVLYLEGDQFHNFRLLRAVKNRFGATNEVGVFDMREGGLIEVKNPSEIFLASRDKDLPGVVVGAIVEGTRSFLVEVQALVTQTHFGYPQRRSIGFDNNRLQLITAILSRRCGINLGNYDVHINIAGGIDIREPAVDLPVCLSIISAFKNKPFDPKIAACGEVGLGAEVRPINSIEKRIKEAERLGFNKILVPRSDLKSINRKIEIIQIKNLNDAMKLWL